MVKTNDTIFHSQELINQNEGLDDLAPQWICMDGSAYKSCITNFYWQIQDRTWNYKLESINQNIFYTEHKTSN